MHRRLLASVVLVAAGSFASAAGVGTATAAPAAAVAGTVHTVGENTLGQQGGNGLTGVVSVAGGRDHALALKPDGTVLGWGDDHNGAVGDGGSAAVQAAPVPVAGLTGVVAIATGHYHSLALLSDGTARAWGLGSSGQLGNGATVTRRTPVTVTSTGTSPLTHISKLAAGRAHSLAIRDGQLYAWGDNTYGQLGDGTTTNRSRPVPVALPVSVTDVAGGRDYTLAVGADGSLWAWGRNDYGQLGTGTKVATSKPVRIATPAPVVDVEAGAFFSLARTSTGAVLSWGRDNFGQLGLGTTVQKAKPTAVPALSGVVGIACGRDHAMALLSDGSVVAWGLNDAGQLGDGSTTNRLSPTPMPGVTGVEAMGGGRGYTVLLSTG